MDDQTIDGLFRAAAERYPERRFVRYYREDVEHVLSYSESATVIAAGVEHLQALGVEAGDTVGMYLEELVPSLLFFMTCAHLGAIPAPVSPVYSVAALQKILDEVGAKVVLTTPGVAPALVESGLQPVCYGDGDGGGRTGIGWLTMRPSADVERAMAELHRVGNQHGNESPYMIQPTSGSTGESKLVLRTHRTFVRIGRHKSLDIRAEDLPPQRVLLLCSLNHGMAHNLLGTALTLAAELSVTSEVDTRASLEDIRRLDPTYLQMAPRVLRELYHHHRESSDDVENERLFGPNAALLTVGGAPSDAALLHYVAGQGVDIIEGYSASEMSIVALTRRGRWEEGIVGDILPDVEVRIADDGELLAKTPVPMLGYWGNPKATEDAFTEDGFYRTGDFAEITPDRRLTLRGRKRDVFNTYDGSNIHPARIEQMLERLPWARQVVVVGDQRPYVAALIVVDMDGISLDEHDIVPRDAHPEVYARARADIAQINAELENNEAIRTYALLGVPMGEELYASAGQGKVRRNRARVLEMYADEIEALYQATPEFPA